MSTLLVSLRALVALAVSLSVFALVYALAIAPSAEAERFGLRGLKRQRALLDNAAWAHIEPVVRWAGRRLRGWLSERQSLRLDLRITRAGDWLGLLASEIVALSVGGAIAGALLGAVLGRTTGNLVTMFGVALGAAGPFLALESATGERTKRVSRRLPHAIDLLALAMGAGLDFPSAVGQLTEKAGDTSDPLIEELTLVLQSLQIGRTRQQALEEFAHRVPCRSVGDFVGAVVQAEMRGTPVAHVLALQAETGRQQRTNRAEEIAARASLKLIVPLALIFVCVLLVIVAPMVLRFNASMT